MLYQKPGLEFSTGDSIPLRSTISSFNSSLQISLSNLSFSKQSLCSVSLHKLFFSSFLRAFLCPSSFLLAISHLSSCYHSICLLRILIRASDGSCLLPGLALLPQIPVHPFSLFQAALCKLLNESYAEIFLLVSRSQTLCLPSFTPPTARSPFPFSLQAFYSLGLDTKPYPIIATICWGFFFMWYSTQKQRLYLFPPHMK